jgi:hypothetical protein
MDLRRIWLLALTAAALRILGGHCFAQSGVPRSRPPDRAGGTLEVPPRIPAPPAAEDQAGGPPAASASPEASQSADQTDDSGEAPGATIENPAASVRLPYLGLSVQYIVANDVPGKTVRGLEVVGVDPNSPAETAGVRARGPLTKLGASGATAGALMPPLDLVLMPLLKKAGKLGADGDLIIAIDDTRVESENDLKMALETSRPGDLLYLTVVRPHLDGLHETLKLPVKLGQPRS